MKNCKLVNSFLSMVMLCSLSMNTWALVNCTPDPADNLNAVPVKKNVDFMNDINPIFTKVINNLQCTNCHGFLTIAGLVNVASSNINAGIPRVTPGNEELSFLFKKINCTDASLDAGNYGNTGRMPPNGKLSAQDQALILDWIQQGAKPVKVPDADYIFYSGFSRN